RRGRDARASDSRVERVACRRMRVFLAGATGVIGIRLVPLLIAGGHTVAGMTRSEEKAGRLAALSAQPVVCDGFDLSALTKAVTAFEPQAVLHEITDLPDRLDERGEYAARPDPDRGHAQLGRRGSRSRSEASSRAEHRLETCSCRPRARRRGCPRAPRA